VQRVEVDAYVIDVLMRDLVGHDRQPSAFLVYLHLWRRGSDNERRTVTASLREIAEGTGLSKRAVQDGLATLHRRRLIGIHRESLTAVPVYTVHRPWARTKP
jgi:hypothetical protein